MCNIIFFCVVILTMRENHGTSVEKERRQHFAQYYLYVSQQITNPTLENSLFNTI